MYISSKKIWLADSFMAAVLNIEDGIIKDILPYGSVEADKDYGDLRIVPGFIDVHCHGAYGFDTNEPDSEGLRNWCLMSAKEGVTAFLPTTVTQSEEVLTKALQGVAKVMSEGNEGAEILGVHFEGPYLNAKYKGAQPEEYIVKGTIEQFERFQKAANGNIKYITLAPEEDEGYKFIEYLNANGVVVSLGHSSASYEQAAMAFAHGAKSMTHVYNGMSAYNHRNNGLVGAALRNRQMYGEIICDCQHSTAVALNNYFMAKGADYAIMITDSLLVKGKPAGYQVPFGGQNITVCPDGCARLDNGTIAGSTLKVNEGLRNLVEEAMVPFNYAINSCTINPARCLGIDNRKGSIQVGKDGDLVVLANDYSVVQTYCKGKPQI